MYLICVVLFSMLVCSKELTLFNFQHTEIGLFSVHSCTERFKRNHCLKLSIYIEGGLLIAI